MALKYRRKPIFTRHDDILMKGRGKRFLHSRINIHERMYYFIRQALLYDFSRVEESSSC